MSDASGGPTAAEIIAIVHDSFTVNCVEFPVLAFLLYDYLISLDREIELFWTRSLTGASAIYFFTRYTTLICYDVLGAITFAHLSDTSCALLAKAQAAFSMIQYIPWAVFAALRVLALSGMNWPLAILVFLLGIAPVATNFAQYGFNLTGVNDPITGCQAQLSITRVQVEILVIVSRTCLILADTIAVVVTVVQTRKAAGVSSSSGRSLGHVLLYDGVMYFGALLCFSILDLALSVIALITPHHSGTYVTALTDPLTAILVSRFLLDLQAANTLSVASNSRNSLDGEEGTLMFAGVIGSLGASLGGGEPGVDSVDAATGDESKSIGHEASHSMELMEVPKQIEEVHLQGS